MRFENPILLNWLWVILLLVGFFILSMRARRKRLYRLANAQLLQTLLTTNNIRLLVIKKILLSIVVVLAIVALARPQWGFEWQEVKRQGLDIMVVLDTSRSMLTEDVKPNRLQRVKLAIGDFIKKLHSDRIGLVVFSGKAFLACPLTVDYSGFMLALDDINTQTIPQGGTNLAEAIKTAIESYQNVPSQYKVVLILTDGDSLEGDPLSVARNAAQLGIKIYTIGVGTQEGELIRIPDERGGFEFLKDNQGNFVKSRLNESLLGEIAQATSGAYVRASGAQFGLDIIYDQYLSRLEKRDIESKHKRRYHEQFQIPLGVAFLLLLLETMLPFKRKVMG